MMKTSNIRNWKFVILSFAKIEDGKTDHVDPSALLKNVLKDISFSPSYYMIYLENVLLVTEGKSLQQETRMYIKTEKEALQLEAVYADNEVQGESDLTYIFNEIHKFYPTTHTLLSTFGHGSAFGIFKTEPAHALAPFQPDVLSERYDVLDYAELGTEKEIRSFKLILKNKSLDLKTLKTKSKDPVILLTNDELAHAIQNSFGKVDIIMMNNCFMQNILTCYSLKNVADFLIASEGTFILTPGYHYKKIIESTVERPMQTVEALAKLAIDTMNQVYVGSDAQQEYEKQATFAVSLKSFNEFLPVFRSRLDQLIELAGNRVVKNAFRDAANRCYTHDAPENYAMIDFVNIFRYVSENNVSVHYSELVDIFNEFELHYTRMVNGRYTVGNNVYYSSVVSYEKTNNIDPTGGTIHFPSRKITSSKRKNLVKSAFYPCSFLTETQWRNFVNAVMPH